MKKLKIKKPTVISERVEAEHQDYIARIEFCARNFADLKALVMRRKIRGALLFESEYMFRLYMIENHCYYSRIFAETMDDIMRVYCPQRYARLLKNAGINHRFSQRMFPYRYGW